MKIATFLALVALVIAGCSSSLPPTTTPTPAIAPSEQEEVEPPPVSDPSRLPDLVMDYSWQVTYTSLCPWGGPGYVIMRGRNVGPGDATSFHIKVWDQLTPVENLKAGDQVEARADFDSGPVGSIPAFIDSEQEVEESDEGNNEVLIVFTPPPKCTPEGE